MRAASAIAVPVSAPPRPRARLLVAVSTTILLWASAFAAIRASMGIDGSHGFSPFALALLRFLIASAALAIYSIAVKMPLPRRRDLPMLGVMGLTGIAIYHTLLNWGEMRVSAGPASLIINTAPIFTAILATIFLHERLRLRGWLGMVICLAGVVLIGMGESRQQLGDGFNWYSLLILGSALSGSIFIVMQKTYLRRYSALQLTTWSIWAGAICMLPFAPMLLRELPQVDTRAIVATAYLGVCPAALAYVTWTYVLSQVPASRAASLFYLVSAVAFVIAWVWLREAVTLASVGGGVIVIAGVVLVNTRSKS